MNLLKKFFAALLSILLLQWLRLILKLFAIYWKRLRSRSDSKKLPHRIRHNVTADCAPIKAINYKRADPLIYSQDYLRKLGMAVTWDNPDIQLYEGLVPVSSHQLKPSTNYRVVARISNSSTEAPVVGMPVKFSFLDFGAGAISVPIGTTYANVGVLGGANNPTFAEVNWTTPARAGHYCIQILLVWADDINPENNLGQENTDVVQAASPAQFKFRVRNSLKYEDRFHVEFDTYKIPPPIDCRETEKIKKDLRSFFIERNKRGNFPLPPDWKVELYTNDFLLNPGQEIDVEGQITPPDDFIGIKPFNFDVTAVKRQKQIGGVTIYVEKK